MVEADGGFVVKADDKESVEDVVGVVAGEAVEAEVKGVEASGQAAARDLESASAKSRWSGMSSLRSLPCWGR